MAPKKKTATHNSGSSSKRVQHKSDLPTKQPEKSPGGALKRKRIDVPETPKKKIKITHSSHSLESGACLTVGEGDVGQLGLGPDVIERVRCALVELPTSCKQVVAGGMHTVCLTSDGQVYTFGCNDEGALGRDTGEEDSETKPALMTGLNQAVAQVSAGDSHTRTGLGTCCKPSTFSASFCSPLRCYVGYREESGANNCDNVTTFFSPSQTFDLMAVLTIDGEVCACGTFRDANGSIGLTTAGPSKSAIKLSENGQMFQKIASGSDHIVALRSDGALFTCGSAEQGQLGRVAECFTTRGGRKGLSILLNLTEVKFRGTRNDRHPRMVDVWAGTYVTFAKSSKGNIYSWGLNNYYQLGLPDMENKFVPTLVTSLSAEDDWISFAGGQHHTVLTNAKGEVFTVGRGTYGQLGLGESNTGDQQEPTKVESLDEKCFYVSASSSVSFAVSESGTAYAWGMGTSKQLGTGGEDDEFAPKKMAGKQLENRRVVMISSGGQHTVLLAA